MHNRKVNNTIYDDPGNLMK